jgi:hypothetical protein
VRRVVTVRGGSKEKALQGDEFRLQEQVLNFGRGQQIVSQTCRVLPGNLVLPAFALPLYGNAMSLGYHVRLRIRSIPR